MLMTDEYYDDPEYEPMVGEIELTLEDGDNYEDIAKGFETSVEAIGQLNPEVNVTQEPTPGRNIRLPYRVCPGGTIYVVRRGDTLASIAARYRITEAELRRANPFLNVIRFRVGLPLCIPPRRPASCPGGFFYTIGAGDNLYRIASRYGTTVPAILRANPGLDPSRLYVGQRICIPRAQFPTPTPPPVETCPGGFFYTIGTGDTLYSIAIRFNTTVEAIIRANPGFDPNRLYVGQRICIPGRRGPRASEYSEYMGYSGNEYYPEGMY
jgi:LysM repeat protein